MPEWHRDGGDEMERGNSKHSARVDDELSHETGALTGSGQTESRSEESWVQEGLLADEQPAAGAPAVHGAPGPGALSDDEVERRSELARWLEPHLFPARRDELVAGARDRLAPGPVTELLERLPDEGIFSNVEAVWEAVGGQREHRS